MRLLVDCVGCLLLCLSSLLLFSVVCCVTFGVRCVLLVAGSCGSLYRVVYSVVCCLLLVVCWLFVVVCWLLFDVLSLFVWCCVCLLLVIHV